MTINGVDFSDGRPTGKALAAAGIQFVVRYLQYRGITDPHKAITAVEVADYHAHGVSVVANLESTANRALDGSVAGVSDAHDALAAVRGLGFPETCPVYFSVDFAPQAKYFPLIDSYFAGILTVLPLSRVGVYGGGDLLRHLAAKRLASWYWNAASTAWGKLYVGSHIWQYQTGSMGARPINGASVDYDRALRPDYGQWEAPGSAGPAQGVPMYNFSLRPGPGGSLVVKSDPAIRYLNLADGTLHAAAGMVKAIAWPITIKPALGGGALGADRSSGYLIGDDAAFVLASDVTFTPASAPDCNQAIQDAITADRSHAYIAYRSPAI